MSTPSLLDSISLAPSPVVEAYKKDVDRTLIQENLKLSVEQRVRKMMAALRLAEEVRGSRSVQRLCAVCSGWTSASSTSIL